MKITIEFIMLYVTLEFPHRIEEHGRMEKIIDLSNHIMLYSDIYSGYDEVTDSMRRDAENLMYRYGRQAVLDFVLVYLTVQREESDEWC
tara:strand:- start:8981 stop:9247 length:267 start_codon:yes stop_codon:yes gene_type:complete